MIQQASTTKTTPTAALDENSQAAPVPAHVASRQRWLLVIGFFKFAKGVFFVLIGVGVLKLVHRDLADLLLKLGPLAPHRPRKPPGEPVDG